MKFFHRYRGLLGGAALLLAVAFALGVCFFALDRTAAEAQRLTVVLDAGHGGIDGGVTGVKTGVKESDLNLSVVFLLQERFEEAGFRVVLTRKTEAGLYGLATPGFKKRDMQKRAEIICGANPALVISVHMNFFSLPSRRGAQVFFREDSESSKRLACNLQSSLNAMPDCARRSDPLRGDYFILNCSEYPSAIVECGFLSNAEDEALLTDGGYRKELAGAIAAGAMTFLSSPANTGGGVDIFSRG